MSIGEITHNTTRNLTSVDAKLDRTIVNTAAGMTTLLDALADQPTNPPSLYLDLEGVYLCCHGVLSILQLHLVPTGHTYLIDVYTMQRTAFDVPSTRGVTLRDILTSSSIPKVFFDVRNDSDALFALYDVSLQGVQDLQLMELATRSGSKRLVSGLGKCIERDGQLGYLESRRWAEIKGKGLGLFAPEKGGSYEVLNQRPLDETIIDYCTQDVTLLPVLWKCYDRQLTPSWRKKVEEETLRRVKLSHSKGYNGKGRHMALGPW